MSKPVTTESSQHQHQQLSSHHKQHQSKNHSHSKTAIHDSKKALSVEKQRHTASKDENLQLSIEESDQKRKKMLFNSTHQPSSELSAHISASNTASFTNQTLRNTAPMSSEPSKAKHLSSSAQKTPHGNTSLKA